MNWRYYIINIQKFSPLRNHNDWEYATLLSCKLKGKQLYFFFKLKHKQKACNNEPFLLCYYNINKKIGPL